jgi:Cd2+/Zn2+-exporting ATPase
VLRYAAIAESQSDHPIAKSIVEAYGQNIHSLPGTKIEEISGHGIDAEIDGVKILVGNDRLMHRENIQHKVCNVGSTVVHVAIDGQYAGYITISDSVKDDSKSAILRLRELGVSNIVMLTGDNNSSASLIASELNITSFKSDLLPEDKVTELEKLISELEDDEKLAFVGDGINDAPVLARADVGIAMGAMGSDAAVETADVVIMTDSPAKVPEAIKISSKTRTIVWQNIIFALSVKLIFILGGGLGLATMWEAVFGDMGVALIAILNSTRVLK